MKHLCKSETVKRAQHVCAGAGRIHAKISQKVTMENSFSERVALGTYMLFVRKIHRHPSKRPDDQM